MVFFGASFSFSWSLRFEIDSYVSLVPGVGGIFLFFLPASLCVHWFYLPSSHFPAPFIIHSHAPSPLSDSLNFFFLFILHLAPLTIDS
ncbi:hypothetical protein BC936DRAFT_147510 [Jimgerdemannia flammicorona]|uniref:Uncharacterized protein n=2 Tax=Jimgerdemannia flammicorona TaxID=994334 RepID=A0A433QGM5_9FUNG|nr:hypothetical protein BC936DRAFT_147510 [Jimgerdemannia flammicorona]RUS28731.1 hypothetical protein BC938DRAFT_481518 [Jimgerdemannia flammicorona]